MAEETKENENERVKRCTDSHTWGRWGFGDCVLCGASWERTIDLHILCPGVRPVRLVWSDGQSKPDRSYPND